MNETKIVLDVVLVSDDETTEVEEPAVDPFGRGRRHAGAVAPRAGIWPARKPETIALERISPPDSRPSLPKSYRDHG